MSRQGRKRTRSVENVKNFWNNEAKEWGSDPRVTIRDHYFRLLEINTITNLITGSHQCLDIGCGTGFSSLYYSKVVDFLIGIDYAELMVKKAKRYLTDKNYFNKVMKNFAGDKVPFLKENIMFEEGNILDLKYSKEYFDSVITERVLINLPKKVQQNHAVKEIFRILGSKGLWVLVEVTKQGHNRIDKMRRFFGLSRLEKYWHNLYIDEDNFEDVLKKVGFKLRKKIYFETYQFLTKVVHPLVTNPKEPKFISGFNKAAKIIAEKYPSYKIVSKIGLNNFLTKKFRPLLKKYEPSKLKNYDKTIALIVRSKPDFTSCSHQILFIIDKQ